MTLSPELANQLLKLANLLADQHALKQKNAIHKKQMLGLGATVLGLPVTAMFGLKPTMGLLGFGLYNLFKAKQQDDRLKQLEQLRSRLLPRPHLSPRLRPY